MALAKQFQGEGGGKVKKIKHYFVNLKTRMTTFIKMKLNKSDDQTNIDNIE